MKKLQAEDIRQLNDVTKKLLYKYKPKNQSNPVLEGSRPKIKLIKILHPQSKYKISQLNRIIELSQSPTEDQHQISNTSLPQMKNPYRNENARKQIYFKSMPQSIQQHNRLIQLLEKQYRLQNQNPQATKQIAKNNTKKITQARGKFNRSQLLHRLYRKFKLYNRRNNSQVKQIFKDQKLMRKALNQKKFQDFVVKSKYSSIKKKEMKFQPQISSFYEQIESCLARKQLQFLRKQINSLSKGNYHSLQNKYISRQAEGYMDEIIKGQFVLQRKIVLRRNAELAEYLNNNK